MSACLWICLRACPLLAPGSPLWSLLITLGLCHFATWRLSTHSCLHPLPSVPPAKECISPDMSMASFTTMFKYVLKYHLVNEASLNLPTTLVYATQMPVLPTPSYFPIELSMYHLAIYFTFSPTRMEITRIFVFFFYVPTPASETKSAHHHT